MVDSPSCEQHLVMLLINGPVADANVIDKIGNRDLVSLERRSPSHQVKDHVGLVPVRSQQTVTGLNPVGGRNQPLQFFLSSRECHDEAWLVGRIRF